MGKSKVTKKTVAMKYRQGTGWVVSSYCPPYDSWIVSSEMSYWGARAVVKALRESWNTKKQEYEFEPDI